MIVKKRKSQAMTVFCANRNDGCRFPSGAPREATHVAELIGYDVPLCQLCARDFERIYMSALHPASWERTLCRKDAA